MICGSMWRGSTYKSKASGSPWHKATTRNPREALWGSTIHSVEESRGLDQAKDSMQWTVTSKNVWAKRYTVWLTRPHVSFHAKIFSFFFFVFTLNFVLVLAGGGCKGRGWEWGYKERSGIRMHDLKSTENQQKVNKDWTLLLCLPLDFHFISTNYKYIHLFVILYKLIRCLFVTDLSLTIVF